jgi:hypothetical protein
VLEGEEGDDAIRGSLDARRRGAPFPREGIERE